MWKNFVYSLFLCLACLVACDRPSHLSPLFQEVERIMPQHPDSALTLLERISDPESLSRKDKARYYLLLTEAQDKTYAPHTTDSLIAIATDYYEKTDDPARKAKAWYYRGRINQDLDKPLKAQEYYLKALREEEKIEDHALLGRVNNNIGMLYTYQEVYDKALLFQKKAVENFRLLKDSTGQAFALRDLGRTFLMLGHPDSAIIRNQKALALMGEKIIPSVYTELAGLYADKGDLEESRELLRIALRNTTNPQAKYSAYLVLGELFQRGGQLDSARFYLQACADSAPLPATRAGGLFHLKEIAIAEKQCEQVIVLSEQYESLRDSIEKRQQTESIRKIQAFYSYNEMEQDLWEARLQASEQRLKHFLSITGFLILLSGGALFFVRYIRERKNMLQQLNDNKKQIHKNEQTIHELSFLKDGLLSDIQGYREKEQQLRQEYKTLLEKKEGQLEQQNELLEQKSEQLKETKKRLDQKREQLDKLLQVQKSITQKLEALKAENSKFKEQEDERTGKLSLLQEEKFYDKFRSPVGWEPSQEDWNRLFISVEKSHLNFATALRSASLCESEKRICYLIKIGVKPGAVASLLHLENVSIYRKRLYEKLTKKVGKAKDLDKYISDL